METLLFHLFGLNSVSPCWPNMQWPFVLGKYRLISLCWILHVITTMYLTSSYAVPVGCCGVCLTYWKLWKWTEQVSVCPLKPLIDLLCSLVGWAEQSLPPSQCLRLCRPSRTPSFSLRPYLASLRFSGSVSWPLKNCAVHFSKGACPFP